MCNKMYTIKNTIKIHKQCFHFIINYRANPYNVKYSEKTLYVLSILRYSKRHVRFERKKYQKWRCFILLGILCNSRTDEIHDLLLVKEVMVFLKNSKVNI